MLIPNEASLFDEESGRGKALIHRRGRRWLVNDSQRRETASGARVHK